jgi:enoyl-[acyl-carrier protein] reductase II
MYEGDLVEGELEIGQAASLVGGIKAASEIVNEIWLEFQHTIKEIKGTGL